MKFFARCIDSIERRPFIISSFFLFFLVFSCFEQFLYSIYKTLLEGQLSNIFSFLSSGNENVSDLGNLNVESVGTAANTGNVFLTVLVLLLCVFAFSAVISVYLSGYLHVLNISLKPNKEKEKGEFKKGLVKHYFKFAVYIFIYVIIVLSIAVGLAVAVFPALLSFNMVYTGGNNGLLLISIFLIIVSALVLSFVVAIILMYATYMLPALINFKKGAFYMAKKVVNAKFWYILPRLMAFVILFAIWQWIMADIGYGLSSTITASFAAFAINAIVKTYLIFMLIFFVFFTFRQIRNALLTEETDETDEDKIPVKKVNDRLDRSERADRQRQNSRHGERVVRRVQSDTEIMRDTGRYR